MSAVTLVPMRSVAPSGASAPVVDGRPGAVSPPPSVDALVGALAQLVRNAERAGRFATDAGDGRLRPSAGPAEETRSAEAPGAALDATVAEAIAPELDSMIARANGDPLLLLTLVDSAFHASRLESSSQGVESARRTSERAALERERAIDNAIRQAGRGRRRMPKWLKKLLKAIATVASIVASAFSGGALAAVAIAGIVLMLAAPHIGKLAVKLGMDPDDAKWLVLGLQIVGAAMSMVSGGAAGAAGAAGGAQAAQAAERAAELTSRIVGAATKIVEGSEQVAQSVFDSKATAAQLAADAASVRYDAASLGLEDAVGVLRDGMRSLERSSEARADLLRLRTEATQAVLQRAI